jgi:transcriptional regulator with XRE-family HTH domain
MTQTPPTRIQNGPAIRAIRERSELTVRQVCDLIREHDGIDVHPNHIRNVETNARGASPQLIGAIARALKVPKVAILAEAERPEARTA